MSRGQGFQDLDVYKRLYAAMLVVMTKVLPRMPAVEKYDLADQIRRSCKAPVALLAEGYSKKRYRKDWSRYMNDAIGECNEMIAHLSIMRDAYPDAADSAILAELIRQYDVSGKQLHRLSESWIIPSSPTSRAHPPNMVIQEPSGHKKGRP